MPLWVGLLLLAGAVFNLVSTARLLFLARRMREQARRSAALELLLAQLCLRAFCQEAAWRAWVGTIGEIEITAKPWRGRTDDG